MKNADLRALQLLLVEPGLTTTDLRIRVGYQRHEVLEAAGLIKFKEQAPAKLWYLTGKGRDALMLEMGNEGIKDLRENGVPAKHYNDRLGSIEQEILRYLTVFPGVSTTEINRQCGGVSTCQRLEAKGLITFNVSEGNGWKAKEWYLTKKGEAAWDETPPRNDRGRWSGSDAIWKKYKSWKKITPKNISKEYVLTYAAALDLLHEWTDAGRVEAIGEHSFKVV